MEEKRKHPRYTKRYNLMYSLKESPQRSNDISEVHDISQGGLSFTSQTCYELGQVLVFSVKFPFLYPKITFMEGEVVDTLPLLQGKTFMIGVKFVHKDGEAEEALKQMEQFNKANPR